MDGIHVIVRVDNSHHHNNSEACDPIRTEEGQLVVVIDFQPVRGETCLTNEVEAVGMMTAGTTIKETIGTEIRDMEMATLSV